MGRYTSISRKIGAAWKRVCTERAVKKKREEVSHTAMSTIYHVGSTGANGSSHNYMKVISQGMMLR